MRWWQRWKHRGAGGGDGGSAGDRGGGGGDGVGDGGKGSGGGGVSDSDVIKVSDMENKHQINVRT